MPSGECTRRKRVRRAGRRDFPPGRRPWPMPLPVGADGPAHRQVHSNRGLARTAVLSKPAIAEVTYEEYTSRSGLVKLDLLICATVQCNEAVALLIQ